MTASPAVTPSDRLQLVPHASRRLGADLLVSAGGATSAVERLTGSEAQLWTLFGAGFTVGEAIDRMVRGTGEPPEQVEQHVLAFADDLLDAGLAERAP